MSELSFSVDIAADMVRLVPLRHKGWYRRLLCGGSSAGGTDIRLHWDDAREDGIDIHALVS
jgi:hypothetical protein